MAKPLPPPSPIELNAFTVLVLRYLDEDCSAEEVAQLKQALSDSVHYREAFVQVCRVHGDLHEAFAPTEGARTRAGATLAESRRRPAKSGAREASGESASLAGGTGRSATADDPRPSAAQPAEDPGDDTLLRASAREDTIGPGTKPPKQ